MLHRRLVQPLAALTPFALAGALAAPAAALQDPFAAGERWSAAPADGGTEWTPEEIALSADGAFVWAGLRGGDHALALYDRVAAGTQAPRGVVTRGAAESTVPSVAAGNRGDRVYALRQLSAPTVFRRVPVVLGYDPLQATQGAEMTAFWAHDTGLQINGPTRLATDASGDLVVAAAWDDSTGQTQIDVLSGTDGSLLGRATLPAVGLSALDVSADGSRIGVVCGLDLHVLDRTAQVLHTEALASSTFALALSENGSTIAFGQIGALRTIADPFGFGYAPSLQLPAQGPELPSRLDLSADGTMIAVAWWNYSTGRSARLEIFDSIFGFALASHAIPGSTTSSQNLPTDVRITANGHRAVMGSWGNGQDAEVVVLDAGGFGPSLVVDLPGSVRALDMDATGTRIAIAHKDVHAQVFGARGAVRLVDTGERALQTTRTPELGGTLEMAARHGSATGGFFLFGSPAAAQTFPGVTGQLLLDRSSLRLVPAAVDGSGRMDLSLPIGTDPNLIGVRLNVQAAFRTPGGIALTQRLERPYVVR